MVEINLFSSKIIWLQAEIETSGESHPLQKDRSPIPTTTLQAYMIIVLILQMFTNMLGFDIMSNSYWSSPITEISPKSVSVHSLEEVLKPLSVFMLMSIISFFTY